MPPYSSQKTTFQNVPIPNVKQVFAVASGKGGVGKSTVCVNLALTLAQQGLRVGVLDCDVFGPSIPQMIALHEKPKATTGKQIIPHSKFDVEWMSLGFLLPENSAVIWRGLMVQSAMSQLLFDISWGLDGEGLDVLLLDLPPGTGDVQLTLSQKIKMDGAIIVSTPQDVALIDARKAVDMFQKVSVPITGMIENMSFYQCSQCGHHDEIFGHGGAAKSAGGMGVPFLGEIPIRLPLRVGADQGLPGILSDDKARQAFQIITKSMGFC